jgi:c-di-GMP-binding flagellar brake protein YcgR
MTSGKQIVERRKHKRFQPQIDTPIILRSHHTKAASIVDLSMGGVGFSCIGGEKVMCESMKISILPAENSFYLYKIPCKMVWNREVEKDHNSSLTTRRCGVQFDELTPHEVSQLEHFIQNYATGDT